MKLPKYVVRIGGVEFLVPTKQGIGAIAEFLADAMPVNTSLHKEPPEIELTWAEEPASVRYLQRVECVPIPRGVVWTQKTKQGEVQVVRPVEKAPKPLPASKVKALRGPERKALPPPSNQLALL